MHTGISLYINSPLFVLNSCGLHGVHALNSLIVKIHHQSQTSNKGGVLPFLLQNSYSHYTSFKCFGTHCHEYGIKR